MALGVIQFLATALFLVLLRVLLRTTQIRFLVGPANGLAEALFITLLVFVLTFRFCHIGRAWEGPDGLRSSGYFPLATFLAGGSSLFAFLHVPDYHASDIIRFAFGIAAAADILLFIGLVSFSGTRIVKLDEEPSTATECRQV